MKNDTGFDFKLNELDDFRLMFESGGTTYRKSFQGVIQSHFDKFDGELLLCLGEIVSRSDINSKNNFGEYFLYSGFEEQRVTAFLSSYEAVIDEVKNASPNGHNISEHKSWYRHSAYIIRVNNKVPLNQDELFWYLKNRDWNELQSNRKPKQMYYYETSNDVITNDYIVKYLTKYVDIIHGKLNLSIYPRYTLVVRPISVTQDDKIIPLGNVYLVIATKNELDDSFYALLLKDIIVTWWNKYGVKAIEETLHNGVRYIELIEFLPTFEFTASKTKLDDYLPSNRFTLKDYYIKLVESQEKLDSFKTKAREFILQLVPQFYKIYEGSIKSIPEDGLQLELPVTIDPEIFWKITKIGLNKEFDIDLFEIILLRRKFILIGFLIFNLELKALVECLKSSGLYKVKNISESAIFDALQVQLFFPYKRHVNSEKEDFFKEKTKTAFIDSLSPFEKKCIDDAQFYFQLLQNADELYS